MCCSSEELVAIAAPRGHAKSTAISLAYTMASVLFRQKGFVLIVSATYEQSCLFLGGIKSHLYDNQDLRDLFEVDAFEKDTEHDIIVRFKDGTKFRIMAKGSEQSLRGALWDDKRPDLIICDDLESDEQVENKERRKKFRQWFFGALVPCKSDTGVIRVVGTILHMDSLLERLMPKEKDPDTVKEQLKIWSKQERAWKSVKYQAHNDDFSAILWPEQWPEKRLKKVRQQFIDDGQPEVYSREFRNRPLDEEFASFRVDDFVEMTEKDHKLLKQYHIAVDLAISERETADYSAFIVGGVDQDGNLHIVDVVKDRLNGKEIVDCLFYLNNKWQPDMIVIEKGAIERSLGAFINVEMFEEGNSFLPILTMAPVKDKTFRSKSIQARMKAKKVKFDFEAAWFQDLQDEMLMFPKAAHDDQVDAMSYLGLSLHRMNNAPTPREHEEELWEEEKARSDFYDEGRSPITGY